MKLKNIFKRNSKNQDDEPKQRPKLFNPRPIKKPTHLAKTRHKKPNKLRRFQPKPLKRRLQKYIRIVLILAGVVTLIYGLYYLIIDSSYFNVKNLEVVGADKFVDTTDVEVSAQTYFLDKKIYSLDTSDAKSALQKNFLGIRDIVVNTRYPDSVELVLIERVPVAVLLSQEDPTYYVVDDTGFIFGFIDYENTNLPVINYDGELLVGKSIDANLMQIYNSLLSSLDKYSVDATKILLRDSLIELTLNDGATVLIPSNNEVVKNIVVLKNLLNQLQLEDKIYSRIDLRYDKVVVQ